MWNCWLVGRNRKMASLVNYICNVDLDGKTGY
jgi:hypothetical protein